ncbi:MAG TPA: mercury(II) reductase [Propionibacteriaceae bacterium]|nr:mercury(II) reductase [Propionibacteriaceae bacterium]
MSYDLVVIGSGGAAFSAAIAARRKNKTVAMIERGTIGGTCVNTGCVPSKALLAAAEARHIAGHHPFPGIRTDAGPVDFPALITGMRALVEQIRADKYIDLAAHHDWHICRGAARFVAGPSIEVALPGGGSQRIEAEHYVIATGSAPVAPLIPGLAEAGYLTSTSAMELDELPDSLIVLGSGYVGLELAQLFAHLGTQVTVVEILDRLAPAEEPETSRVIEDVFADEGIQVRTRVTVTSVHRTEGTVFVTLCRPDGNLEQLRAQHVLVATGRRPVTDDLNLATVGVKTGDRGEVLVDPRLRTHHSRIWAAGDVTGYPQFVYVAGAHGALIAENAFDNADRTLDYRHLPRVTFTSPQVASVGLTEEQAIRRGLDCTCRVLPLDYLSRALVNRDTRGLVKIVAQHATGRVLGVSLVAPNAGDAILAAVYAVKHCMTVDEMADTWAPYLTVGEGLRLAAQTFTRDIALLSCCAS